MVKGVGNMEESKANERSAVFVGKPVTLVSWEKRAGGGCVLADNIPQLHQSGGCFYSHWKFVR